jgi:hypothetical protein
VKPPLNMNLLRYSRSLSSGFHVELPVDTSDAPRFVRVDKKQWFGARQFKAGRVASLLYWTLKPAL